MVVLARQMCGGAKATVKGAGQGPELAKEVTLRKVKYLKENLKEALKVVRDLEETKAQAKKASGRPSAATQPCSYTCTPFVAGADFAPSADQKVVHFLRHAQGTHNAAVATEGESAYQNWIWRDARLTDKGKAQAAGAVAATSAAKFDVVLVSPLSRTMQTADIAMPSCKDKMVVDELCRERIGLNPCDFRRDVAELKVEFPHMDFSTIPNADPSWTPVREPLEDLQDRADEFIASLFEQPAETKYIGCVTHNDFLTMLLFDSSLKMGPGMPSPETETQTGPAGKKFANCELKSYVFTRSAGKSERPSVTDLSDSQLKRYPSSVGNKPVVQ
jgi:broad specificity phosphatase PhoE